ncbi:hypothetical protein VTK56DRAFT_8201 [Thermocarpiscus australiensis]
MPISNCSGKPSLPERYDWRLPTPRKTASVSFSRQAQIPSKRILTRLVCGVASSAAGVNTKTQRVGPLFCQVSLRELASG